MEDFEQNQNYEMIKERMKERPINRKKLMRRTLITVSMAVIFGVFACITFLVLEPVISNLLYPEPAPELVELPEEIDEILPEDMLITEQEPVQQITQTIIQKDGDVLEEHVSTYQKLYELTNTFRKSMVTVTGVNQDIDWFNNEFENKGQHSGLIYAGTTKQYFILVDSVALDKAEEIRVTFQDGTAVTGTFVQKDANIGLSVIAVQVSDLTEATKDSIKVANLGSSQPGTLVATPVLILGRPFGTESVAYGMIASKGTTLNMADSNYELLRTDIYGSVDATGFLINMSGSVLGIVKQTYNPKESANLLSAIGITEIKHALERMSNGQEASYLGVNGIDVTQDANRTLGVPLGAYVTNIIMDSPAMKAGIQSGDIIVGINEEAITSYSQYSAVLASHKPEETINVVIKRQGNEEYREITLPIILGRLK